jgi:hypothetical protein
MPVKITRKNAFEQYPAFPWANYEKDEFFFPPTFKSEILTLSSKSAKGHARALSVALTRFAKHAGYKSLVFVGDTPTSWRYQYNDYAPVKTALQYLKDNRVGEKFNGALEVDITELGEFTRHLFWLARCNAALPLFHFMDRQQSVVGCICKFGNVHISTLNETAHAVFEDAVAASGFSYLQNAMCQ